MKKKTKTIILLLCIGIFILPSCKKTKECHCKVWWKDPRVTYISHPEFVETAGAGTTCRDIEERHSDAVVKYICDTK